MDTKADWDSASEVIYNSDHPSWTGDPHHVLFLHETFTPSARSFSMNSFGKRVSHLHPSPWQNQSFSPRPPPHSLPPRPLPSSLPPSLPLPVLFLPPFLPPSLPPPPPPLLFFSYSPSPLPLPLSNARITF